MLRRISAAIRAGEAAFHPEDQQLGKDRSDHQQSETKMESGRYGVPDQPKGGRDEGGRRCRLADGNDNPIPEQMTRPVGEPVIARTVSRSMNPLSRRVENTDRPYWRRWHGDFPMRIAAFSSTALPVRPVDADRRPTSRVAFEAIEIVERNAGNLRVILLKTPGGGADNGPSILSSRTMSLPRRLFEKAEFKSTV
jgi:hypothetical protein